MTALPSAVSTDKLDQGAVDTPAQARPQIQAGLQAINQMRSFLEGLLGSDGTKETARAALDVLENTFSVQGDMPFRTSSGGVGRLVAGPKGWIITSSGVANNPIYLPNAALNIAASALAYAIMTNDAASIAGTVGAVHLSDDFETDSLATKTNATYDADNDWYANVAETERLEITHSPTGSNTIDWTQASRPYIGVRFTAAATEEVAKAVLEIQSVGTGGTAVAHLYEHGNATPIATSEGAAVSGAGEVEFTFATPATVTAAGDYVLEFVLSGASAQAKPKTNATGGTITNQQINASSLYNMTADANVDGGEYLNIGYVGSVTTDMTLRPAAETLDTADPTDVIGYFLVEPVDSVTMGTDVLGKASIDGGSTWATGDWTQVGDIGDYELWRLDADVSGQSGSSLVYSLETANTKHIRAVACVGCVVLY